jgi:FtsP/CotA-like multicopper oxidase with cupredoxin domain
VFEPGLRDTVEIRGAETATVLGYFDNPGQWMVHCHISEHSERGMMAEIQVGAPTHMH